MKKILSILFISALASYSVSALEISGHANSWFFFQTDDVASTTVAIVKRASDGTVLGIAVGSDIKTECAETGVTCEYRTIGQGTELDLQRTTGDITNPTLKNKGEIGGDTLLWNLGTNTKFKNDKFNGKINGNFTTSLMNDRALTGHDTYRFRFTELYGEYDQGKWAARLGRQHVAGGVLVDGIGASYFLGDEGTRDSLMVGAFAGAAPDPISKNPSKDYLTFGPHFQWIPKFSQTSETKFFLESALVTELYKGAMNRFYLYAKAHFTPINWFSGLLYTNLELPWKGNDGEFGSSLFSFQSFLRPSSTWLLSLGFTQFRIDRHLQEQGVRWVTDNGSLQGLRMGESLDRSQRYRLDLRLSAKLAPNVQPYIRGRYERRTFDSNKTDLNAVPPETATTNLALLNQKNAWLGAAGIKLNFIDRLDTESSGTYGQRFQSKFYSLLQTAAWDAGFWTADTYFQYVWSRRTIDASVGGSQGAREASTDYYAGTGGSYRFLSHFLAQLRYEFGNEDDKQLGRRITLHSLLLRMDYQF